MNLTLKRAALLKLLDQRGEFYVSGLAEILAPRGSIGEHKVTWSRQGAARWGGAYVRPLERAGLIRVNRMVDSGVGIASLTDKGLAALREHEGAVSRRALDADLASAVASGE